MRRFLAIFTVLLALGLVLACSSAAVAASTPQLDGLEIIGSDAETYLDGDDFDADETDYDLDDLDEDVTYLKLYLDYDDDDYDVDVDYDGDGDVEEKSSYWKVAIDDMDDLGDITITVTNVDDEDDYEEYTVSLDSDSSGSGADELDDLYLNAGDAFSDDDDDAVDLLPEFDEDVLDYAVLLPYDDDLDGESLNLRLYVEDDGVDLTVEDSSVSAAYDDDADAYCYDYCFSIPDQGDSTTVEFTVEDVDYSLTVYFADEDADDEAVLDDLAVRTKKTTSSSYDLTLDPDFDEDEDAYDLAVDEDDYDTLYLYPESDDDLVILVEDQLVDGYFAFDPSDYDELTITVYAPNLDDYQEYSVNLEEGGSTLSSLYVYSSGYGSISLSPTFSAAKYNYSAQVDSSVSTVYIVPGSTGTVKISQSGGSYVTYSAYSSFTLSDGLNVFDIQVGSNTHYYVNVYRQASSSSIVASNQYVSVNSGSAKQIAAYNINGNNFVKLRDVAYLLNGTAKQFSVGYNSVSRLITLTSGGSYVSVGGEMSLPGAYGSAAVTNQTVYQDGSLISPTAYNIDGNNYFLLRDLAALFDFGVSFSGSTVSISTSSGYSYSS